MSAANTRPLLAHRLQRRLGSQATWLWGGLVLLTVCASAFAVCYGLTVPYADEWPMVGVVTGRSPINLAWLWSPHNEHRMPLPKLAYLAAGLLTGYRFWLMPLSNVVALAAAACSWLITMRRLRGRSTMMDLLVPALLLHLGHEWNLIWSFQINFCLACSLSLIALLLIAGASYPLHPATCVLLAIVLMLLAACGTFGLVSVPFLAVWMGLCGAIDLRSRSTEGRRGLVPAVLSILLLIMVGAYVAVFPQSEGSLRSPNGWRTVEGAIQFLANAWGPLGRATRPFSELAIFALVAGALGILISTPLRTDTARLRRAGLLSFLLGGLALAMAVSYGRAGGDPMDLYQSRYAILGVPLIACLFLVWQQIATAPVRRRFEMACLIALPVLLGYNEYRGWRFGQREAATFRAIVAELQTGASPRDVSRRWSTRLQCAPLLMEQHLLDLRTSRLGPFRETTAGESPLDSQAGLSFSVPPTFVQR